MQRHQNVLVFDNNPVVSHLVHRGAEIKSKEEQKLSQVMVAFKEIGGMR